MSETRAWRGWNRDELADRLVEVAALTRSSPSVPLEAMHVEEGWREERSEAVVAREPPGPPRPDGMFAHAKQALAAYAFSDPTIVEAHFDPASPLRGRRMLLELKVLGLHYLCGVEVVDVRDDRDERTSTFGFRYDTLAGHIERGGEWFFVTKDHETGEIRLCITSRWRLGDMPNAWTRVGFRVLAPYYRALWLRRAHERLRALLAKTSIELTPAHAPVVDEGPPTETLSALPERAHGRLAATLATATVLGTLTGMRSFAGISLVAARSVTTGAQPGAGRAERTLAHPGAALALGVLALGEVIVDKLPWTTRRTHPMPLTARIAFGALGGAIQARRWRRGVAAPAIVGALAAVASTFIAYTVRKRTSERYCIPSALLGAVEDAIVLGGASLTLRALRRAEPPAYVLDTHEERRPAGRRRVIA